MEGTAEAHLERRMAVSARKYRHCPYGLLTTHAFDNPWFQRFGMARQVALELLHIRIDFVEMTGYKVPPVPWLLKSTLVRLPSASKENSISGKR